MKNKVIFPLIFVVFGAACGGDDEARRKGANGEYEVVQEGSASGVTSSIQGPGESVPLTGTNADTTTAFTIDPNAVASTTPGTPTGGTLATTLPSQPMYPSASPVTAQPMTSSASRPSFEPPRQQPQPVRTQPAQSQPQPAEERPPATDTAASQPPTQSAPPAQTAPPTNQPPQEQPKPPAKETEEEEESEEEEPPPPTTTDTRGQR